MNILGIHGHLLREDEAQQASWGWHDAAAVLVRDGRLVAAIEEERLNRVKHANTFPHRAITHCLSRGGIRLDEVDVIAINRGEPHVDRGARFEWLMRPATEEPTGRALYAGCLRRALGRDVDPARLWFCPHHVAHAWSAIVPSGFDESLVFVADGDGDNLSGGVFRATPRELITLREYAIDQSLGNLYTSIISLIGYRRFDEYKAMGLAPYGNRGRFQPLFDACYHLLPEGGYHVEPQDAWVAQLGGAGLIDRARRKGQPFTQEHMDVAAALQATLERIVLHVLRWYRDATGLRRLCLAGGVAHNCSVNGAVLSSGLFEDVFVQPAAHDAGGAIGAAFAAAVAHREPIAAERWTHVYFGTEAGCGDALAETLRAWRDHVSIEPLGGAVSARAASLIAGGAVIGWVQGRSEFGPRALGNRSILADPRPADNKPRINAMVKKREAFRPFAPAVLVERVRDYFDVPGDRDDLPFMTFVLGVRPGCRDLLGAITHVDGTARVQTVSRAANPRFWELIHAFERLTGVAMVLNTSFNNHAEPIVDSVDDAMACFLTTGLDALVIGDFLVTKRWPELPARSLAALAPGLMPSKHLVRQRRLDPASGAFEPAFGIASTRGEAFGPAITPVSDDIGHILQQADGRRPLGQIVNGSTSAAGNGARVHEELLRLWTDRQVVFTPAR